MISTDRGFSVWPSLYTFQLLLNMPSVGENSNKHLFISASVFPVRRHLLIEY